MHALTFEAILEHADPPVLRLVGEFDLAGIPAFDEAFGALLQLAPEAPVIDLGELVFLASTGLGALLRAQRVLPGLSLRGVRPAQQRVFEVTGVEGVLRQQEPDPVPG